VVKGSIACPVAALRAWLEAAGITAGPVFRSVRKGGKLGERLMAHSVAEIVKIDAERVGLDPALTTRGLSHVGRQAGRLDL
jgi:hypothetical protein